MNEIKVWNYESSEVRTIEKDGEPWFVLSDVCKVLELSSPHKVADRLEDDERNQIPVTDSIGRNQNTTIINESGLYAVILRSDKPQAKPFRKWVTSEVLPSIRKTGSYHSQQQLSPMEMIAAMANNAVEMERRLKETENKIAETSNKLEQALDVFTEIPEGADWKSIMNHRINLLCEQNKLNHQRTRGTLYKELELRVHCCLANRVGQKKKRLKNAGAKYAEQAAVSKLDVIADDPKLRIAFDSIVKKLEAKYIQGDNVQMGMLET